MIRLLATMLMGLAVAAPIAAQAQDKKISIVLVHGAFVDASGWKAVYDLLVGRGYEVLVVQNPTVSLEEDAAYTTRAIAAAKYPVVLVGHSYGGAVITLAGDNPKVRSLVYLAAFAPDVGESVGKLAETPHPGEASAPLLPAADGFLLVDPAKFPTSFAGEVDRSITQFLAAAQVPWGLKAVQSELTKAAWKSKPSAFMITTKDLIIPPTTLRMMAKRAGGKVTEIAGNHAVMLSHPRDVADFIEDQAKVLN